MARIIPLHGDEHEDILLLLPWHVTGRLSPHEQACVEAHLEACAECRAEVRSEQALKAAGGKMEAFYFAFGDTDAFVIVDAPDHATVAAASLTISASGAVRTKTVVLITPEEIDQAAKKTVTYRAPGQ